jgi:hypothetical protein
MGVIYGLDSGSQDVTHKVNMSNASSIDTRLGLAVQTIAMADAAVTLVVGKASSTQVQLVGSILYVDSDSSGASENLLLPPEADWSGPISIVNTGGEGIQLQNDAGTNVALISPGEVANAYSDGTTVFAKILTAGSGIGRQGAPTAVTTTVLLTIAQLRTGIVTVTHSASGSQDYTFPTGTLMSGGTDMQIGDYFEWTLINLSAAAADIATVVAGTDHTLVGAAIVESAHASTHGNATTFRSRMTAATTWITYRVGG